VPVVAPTSLLRSGGLALGGPGPDCFVPAAGEEDFGVEVYGERG